MRSYFYITYLPENVNNELLAARCVNVLHGFVAKEDVVDIGISFPAWSEHTVGNQLAFVSTSKSKLTRILHHNYFSMMKEDGLFYISNIEPVPTGLKEIQFLRNNTIAKTTLGEKRRRNKRAFERAEARGDEYAPVQNNQAQFIHNYHILNCTSGSKNMSFPLYIQKREDTSHQNCDFNHYGLASNKLYSGTVPEFNFDQ
ncbi:type I-F CRISPR-associated endoribonuclease Cas6/Csy4 [Parashewanella spongiae]|uniref:Type I-F CRISPR-associated endoribonuclease Cas6/Csy4 n=1 Tax=Parashewanella spongiae TaxID=342950 RepID=A0A3A6U4R0_9GAMM|nr:type I-F CRISPR-associated endoribonuclease Cas6/Csy4 [Parashewanella spongiae]MCL1076917.1 type I-F CRISPR-associated endoribonuclease Cas6/Csy4 [Parashewanella spongiae]RJY19166.1 type I-F CRISPR-associated endoribonuclease Cas6/Csy4 [Parashewanella spongiae]USN27180.1 type I-F CRISPR-associated endoribonuclease Cas6/Csy4 [synthetic construct]